MPRGTKRRDKVSRDKFYLPLISHSMMLITATVQKQTLYMNAIFY